MTALQEIIVVPTLALTQYKKGEAVGGILEFPDACRHTGPTASLLGATIIDTGLQAAALTLAMFGEEFTPTPDQSPFVVSAIDQLKSVANIEFGASDYVGGDAVSIANLWKLDIPVVATAPTIFGQLFLSFGNVTWPAVDSLTVKLHMD